MNNAIKNQTHPDQNQTDCTICVIILQPQSRLVLLIFDKRNERICEKIKTSRRSASLMNVSVSPFLVLVF